MNLIPINTSFPATALGATRTREISGEFAARRSFYDFWRGAIKGRNDDQSSSTEQMGEKILDLFACVNLLMLQPVTCNMLG
jgi:hypothetical protein